MRHGTTTTKEKVLGKSGNIKHRFLYVTCQNNGYVKHLLQSEVKTVSFNLHFRSLKLKYLWMIYERLKSVLFFQHPVV